MCQACVPGVSVDGYDCDSDLDFLSDDECACPHDHQHDHQQEQNTVEVTFPSDPFFTRLINAARQSKDEIIINDDAHGVQLTYPQFLHDVQTLRLKIQKAVPGDLLDLNGAFKEDVGYVGVLSEIQYPFFVASLAILSMGGVIVPMGHDPEAEQVRAVLDECKAVALVFDPTQADLASTVQKENSASIQLSIDINEAQKSPEDHKQLSFVTASAGDLVFSPDRPALLLFGGENGEPEVLTRQTFYDRATGDPNSGTVERTDAMMLCILICLSSGPPPS